MTLEHILGEPYHHIVVYLPLTHTFYRYTHHSQIVIMSNPRLSNKHPYPYCVFLGASTKNILLKYTVDTTSRLKNHANTVVHNTTPESTYAQISSMCANAHHPLRSAVRDYIMPTRATVDWFGFDPLFLQKKSTT